MKNSKTFRSLKLAAVSGLLICPVFAAVPIFAAQAPQVYQTTPAPQDIAPHHNEITLSSKGFKKSGLLATYFILKGIKEDGSAFVHSGLLKDDGAAKIAIPENANRETLSLVLGYVTDQGYFPCTDAEICGGNEISAIVVYGDDGNIFFKVTADNQTVAENKVEHPAFATETPIAETDPVNDGTQKGASQEKNFLDKTEKSTASQNDTADKTTAEERAKALKNKIEAARKAAADKSDADDKAAPDKTAADDKAAADMSTADDKTAADDKAAADMSTADDKAAADKTAADDKAAADKTAADDKAA
ncbi:MAG: hypothetical protein HUJ54_13780, partial [Erysipelotrichaceae bacterium]|nr:hypothetical protein [Erysipelotrichaceae bacterium]